MTVLAPREASIAFACFGGRVAASVSGGLGVERALVQIRERLETWHNRFTRFDPASELTRLNAHPEPVFHASEDLCLLVAAAVEAAVTTGGLVDPTLAGEIEAVGYRGDLATCSPIEAGLATPEPRRPARPHPECRWRRIEVDPAHRTVTRPPGVRIDSGGIAKGLCADLLGQDLEELDAYVIDCAGDLRIGGRAGLPRTVRVDDPLGPGALHEFEIAAGGVATSGITRRSWLDRDGRVAHHLLDPSTGRPAWTGVIQATALAPTALEAEALAKAAALSSPETAFRWLHHGGVLVFENGIYEVLEPHATDLT
jgi:thiamine biosynthesis lipoprotein